MSTDSAIDMPHGRVVATGTRFADTVQALPPPARRPERLLFMRDLVVFCHLRWDFVYQRPQHLLSRLARHFRVHVVEEPVRCEGEAWLETVVTPEGVKVLKPHTPIGAAGFDDAQQAVLSELLAAHVQAQGIGQCIAWLYTPMALPLLDVLTPSVVVFDCMDDLSMFKGAPPQLRERESALMALADVVLTGGPSLYDARRCLHPNVVCLPSAVDVDHYAPASLSRRPEARDAAAALHRGVARPRLGFFGVIDERLDIGLVDELARADAGWQIVLVGPVVKIDAQSLPRRPNIHWLGQQPYALLPALVADWDVCLLPFALNESTRFISPTKTLEYMAAEKSVVSTAVHDVATLYGEAVRIAQGPRDFVQACRQALAEAPDARGERLDRMRAIVARSSWDHAAARVLAVIDALFDTGPPATRLPGGRLPDREAAWT
jgi:glycosyltransferase involved in cell wall biosynthesis